MLNTETPTPPSGPGNVFWAEYFSGHARPCVWCGVQCWDAWQECAMHSRRHPWHGRAWQRMCASVDMHKRWEAQYARRHPEMALARGGMSVWAGLRIARLRWHWSGAQRSGWQWAFLDYWGLLPHTGMSLAEKLRRVGFEPATVAAKLIEVDKTVGVLPRRALRQLAKTRANKPLKPA